MGVWEDFKREVKKAVPKVTIGKKLDQEVGKVIKTVTVKPIVEGAKFYGGAAKDIAKPVVGGVVGVGNTTLDGAGKLLSNPAAGSVLEGTGLAFGIPGLGNLASPFMGKIPMAPDTPAPTAPTIIQAPTGSTGNNNMLLYVGGGLALIMMTLVFLNFKKR